MAQEWGLALDVRSARASVGALGRAWAGEWALVSAEERVQASDGVWERMSVEEWAQASDGVLALVSVGVWEPASAAVLARA